MNRRFGLRMADLRKASGVNMNLQECRATFAQWAKDRGVSIEAVSRALRHRSTKTTEAYYARMTPENAFRELREAFLIPVQPK